MQVYEAGERCKTKETAHRRPQNQTEASKGYSVKGARKDGILYTKRGYIYVASFPGPAQLSIACSTEKCFFIRAWGVPGNEATIYYHWCCVYYVRT